MFSKLRCHVKLSTEIYATVTKSDLVRTANAWAKLGSRGKVDWLPGFLFKWSICDTQHNTSDFRIFIRHETCSMLSDTTILDIRLQPDQSIAAVFHVSHCLLCMTKKIASNGLASFISSRGLGVLVSFQRTGIVTVYPVTRSAGDRSESLRTVLTTMVEDRQRLSMPWSTPHSNKPRCHISQTGRTIRSKL